MLPTTNADMAKRLEDLTAALDAGDDYTVTHEPAFNGQPQRITVRIESTNRTLVFGLDMAASVAEALEADSAQPGLDLAARLRTATA